MCYGYKPVVDEDGILVWVIHGEYRKGLLTGKYRDADYPFVFPFQKTSVFAMNGIREEMQFDLLPRFYGKEENLSLADALKRKKSRKKDSITGKTLGFTSFNARFETVTKLPSFRNSWFESKRCVIPIVAFKERPNQDIAPKEWQNVEVTIGLTDIFYLGAIWDEWKNVQGEILKSFALITIDSSSSGFFQSIWHERMPVLLNESEAHAWLNPRTSLEEVSDLCKPLPDVFLSRVA